MSLDLDDRQRAMLQEMGLRVWLPEAVAVAPVVAEAPVAPPAPQRVAAMPQAAAQAPVAGPSMSSASAIENIAVHAVNTRASAPKASRFQGPDPTVAMPAVLADGIAAMDWPALAQTITDCQACQLCSGRRAPVFGGSAAAAPRQADWLVVGEPPDDAEERAGEPFAEQAGQLLDNMLKAVGVSRRGAPDGATPAEAATAAYVTNVVKCRPAVVRNPTQQELALCENFLRREVALVRPKVILAMGRFAAQTLLRGNLPEGTRTPFGKLRGQLYRYQGIPVVVTYHPSYLLRTQHDKARAWADLCLALEVVQRGESVPAG
jgi:uracil-DNA glycosylase family 4